MSGIGKPLTFTPDAAECVLHTKSCEELAESDSIGHVTRRIARRSSTAVATSRTMMTQLIERQALSLATAVQLCAAVGLVQLFQRGEI